MKLKELKPVLRSNRGGVQFCIVYDQALNVDIETGCSVEYAVEKYGERTVYRIEAFESQILITI